MAAVAAVYLDNAASTRVADEVIAVMQACMAQDFGNPSSAHAAGIAAARRLRGATQELGALLGDERGQLGDLLWTSGGTEADALALLGAARARRGQGREVVVSAFEHSAVTAAAKLLEQEGFTVITVPVSRSGVIGAQAVADAISERTVVVACLLVQNELGTIQPIADIARAVRARRGQVHIHCDAVQALGKIAVDVRTLGVDSLALSAHKLHGPKGAGALWLRKGMRLSPLWAGAQQLGLRAGTENVPGIAGFGAAATLAGRELERGAAHVRTLRDRLEVAVLAAHPGAQIHGQGAARVPHISSIALPDLPAEPLLHALEGRGVLVSAGSACSAKAKKASATLEAIGVGKSAATLRFSFCRDSLASDVDAAIHALGEAVRELSPPGARRAR